MLRIYNLSKIRRSQRALEVPVGMPCILYNTTYSASNICWCSSSSKLAYNLFHTDNPTH